MSVRPIGGPPLRLVEPSTATAMSGEQLRNQLSAMQAANAPLCPSTGDDAGATLTLDDLNETERTAAHIGASPDAFKPPWMNTHHYTSLLEQQLGRAPCEDGRVRDAGIACALPCPQSRPFCAQAYKTVSRS